jgi:hypothetical protein
VTPPISTVSLPIPACDPHFSLSSAYNNAGAALEKTFPIDERERR